jgi:hypothetical protein
MPCLLALRFEPIHVVGAAPSAGASGRDERDARDHAIGMTGAASPH